MEGCALAVCAGALTWLAFWAWHPGLTYLCLVPLGWAAVRFGARGATAVAALMAVAGEWGTVTDHGLFAAISHDHGQALWLVQLFLAVAVLGGLVLAGQVAELARAEAALRDSERAEQQARLAAREAQAAERARLARDLHDSVSQALFSMSMHARTAQLALARVPHADGGPLARAVGQLRELTAGALAEMRALIFELRPDALAEEGLVAALTRQAAAISAREQLPVTVEGPADPLPLSPEAAEHSYRVALEALHNAVRHAAASHATVIVEADDGQCVRVSVTDDGAGFDPGLARPGHLGLRTMAERARAVGGDLELVTAPGAGTRVQLTVPARPGPAEDRQMTAGAADEEGGPLRVFLVDDHAIVRSGVRGYLELAGDITVAGEAGGGQQALDAIAVLEPAGTLPDVVLMDLVMPGMDGIEATRRIKARWPGIEVVAVTSFVEETKVRSALQAGAAGYLLKDADADQVAAAIRAAAAGQCHLDPAVAKILADSLRAPQTGHRHPDGAGTRRARPDRQRGHQPADRPPARHVRTHRPHARVQHLGQARPGLPHPGRAVGPPARPAAVARRRPDDVGDGRPDRRCPIPAAPRALRPASSRPAAAGVMPCPAAGRTTGKHPAHGPTSNAAAAARLGHASPARPTAVP